MEACTHGQWLVRDFTAGMRLHVKKKKLLFLWVFDRLKNVTLRLPGMPTGTQSVSYLDWRVPEFCNARLRVLYLSTLLLNVHTLATSDLYSGATAHRLGLASAQHLVFACLASNGPVRPWRSRATGKALGNAD